MNSMNFHEICRVDKDYRIFSDWKQGWKYLVLIGKGEIRDIIPGEIPGIKERLEPAEREKLERYME